jgi:5,10-methenyltetrahydrofolate synthetase
VPTRQALRAALVRARKAMPASRREACDAAIAARLIAWLPASGHAPGVLALWWPLPGEPDLRRCFATLAARGWAIALPRVVAPDAPLAFGRWREGCTMVEEHHGVRVPAPFEVVVPSLVLAPCVGFDARGWRLGYGGGYYDRTLAVLPAPAIGVAYDCCEIELAPEPHDRRLAGVITESRTIVCEPAPAGRDSRPAGPV